jgi:hypothetical protein
VPGVIARHRVDAETAVKPIARLLTDQIQVIFFCWHVYGLTAARQPKIMLQVLPIGAGAYPGLDGRFAIASFAGSPDVVYLDNALVGQVAERVEDVPASHCSTTY